MMAFRKSLVCLLGSMLGLAGTGCIVVSSSGLSFGCSRAKVWTDPVTEEVAFDGAGLSELEVRTHNGTITFDGQPSGSTGGIVTVTMKAGGRSPEDAEVAFEAIDVIVERVGEDAQRIGWKWRGMKRPSWAARVSFDIKAPGQLSLNSKTHNGAVTISGVTGDLRAETHNGPVNVEARDGKLYAKTHNGRIVASYTGSDITLVTHNGAVTADLNQCETVAGDITTHNGGVEVVVGNDTSTTLDCRTHNGSIEVDVPIKQSKMTKRRLTGTIGSGDGNLNVTTHNGSVRIRPSAG